MTVSVVCGPAKESQTEMDLHSIISYHPHRQMMGEQKQKQKQNKTTATTTTELKTPTAYTHTHTHTHTTTTTTTTKKKKKKKEETNKNNDDKKPIHILKLYMTVSFGVYKTR